MEDTHQKKDVMNDNEIFPYGPEDEAEAMNEENPTPYDPEEEVIDKELEQIVAKRTVRQCHWTRDYPRKTRH